MKVELRNIKTAGGDETPRFEAKLYIDGQYAAHVSNGGTGGPCQYIWADSKGYAPGPLAKRFHEYCAAKHTEFNFEQEDSEVYELLEQHETKKRLKRACSTKALCRLPGTTYKDGEWSAFKGKLTPELRKALETKYPGIVFCIDTL